MLDFLVRRPIAVTLSFLGALVLGLLAAGALPVSLLPDTPIPRVSVQALAPNMPARELENVVTRPLRNQLLQVGRLRDIRSRTRDNVAVLTLEFEHGTDTDLAFIEVNEQIDQVVGLLPRELERPRVVKANASDIPVMYLSLAPRDERAASPLELSDFARAVVKRRIEQLPQVAFVDLSGYAEPEAAIFPNWERCRALGIGERELEEIIAANNLELGNILMQDGQYQYNVRFLSTLRGERDLEDIAFKHQGRVLRLRDIAEVRLRPRAARGQYLYNGREAVLLTIRKQSEARLFELRRDFEVLLADLRAQYPRLEFAVTHDQSELLRVSVDNLLGSLSYGAFFAFIVLFVFFREWRAPLLIGVAVPLALILALLGFYLLGLSVNIISLAGLILGVGLMIDNSIIVIENIRQYRRQGHALVEACARGGEEVIRPLVSSALTTCSVFLPLIFLSGLAGALFYDQAVSISVALAASLAAAYILLPTLTRLLGARRGSAFERLDAEEATIAGLPTRGYRGYIRVVDATLRRRLWFILLFLSVPALGYWLLTRLPQERFPRLTRPALELAIDWNEAIDLHENRRRVLALLAHFDEAISTSNALLGERQFLLDEASPSLNEAQLTLYQTAMPMDDFAVEARDFLAARHPRAKVEARPLRNLFDNIFGEEGAPLVAHLQSARGSTLPEPAEAAPLLAYLRERGVRVDAPPRQEQYAVRISREAALRHDVPHDRIHERLKTLFNENQLGEIRAADRRLPIVLGAPPQALFQLIENAAVRNAQGDALPLRHFVSVERVETYKEISAGRAGEALELALDRHDETLVAGIRDFLGREGRLSVYFSGQHYENQRLRRELMVVLAVSLMLLYLILAAQFESLRQPFIVLLVVPAGFTGSLLALYLAGQSLNLVALIGMIVTAGIVVNDAILKVDMMNRLRREHGLLAAIHGAGIRRLRPILMTSLTTILALTPVLFSGGLGAELQRPLAWAVVGGLSAGTIASLFFIPLLYGIKRESTLPSRPL
jgi:multidrug efflux pump subunit AcrB